MWPIVSNRFILHWGTGNNILQLHFMDKYWRSFPLLFSFKNTDFISTALLFHLDFFSILLFFHLEILIFPLLLLFFCVEILIYFSIIASFFSYWVTDTFMLLFFRNTDFFFWMYYSSTDYRTYHKLNKLLNITKKTSSNQVLINLYRSPEYH